MVTMGSFYDDAVDAAYCRDSTLDAPALQTNTVAISLLFGMDNEGYLFSAYTGLACEWCRAPNGKDGNM
jgi:hypothetical protein